MKVTANTFYQALLDVSNSGKKDNLALVYGNKEYTFNELLCAIDVCAKDLINMGIKSGDHVGLLGFNSDNWYITFLALTKIRAVAVLLSYSLDKQNYISLMKLTEIKYLIYSDNSILNKDSNLFNEIISGINIESNKIYDIRPSKIDFKDKIKNVNDYDKTYKDLLVDESKKTASFVIFTSGTTSLPKACLLTQYGFLCDIKYYEEVIPELDKKVAVVAIPLYHCFALMETTKLLSYGSPVILPTEFKNEQISEAISKYKANVMVSVSSIYVNLVEAPNFNDDVVPYIKDAIIGGGLMTETQMMRLESAYKNASFVNGYGQTESSVDICLTRPNDTLEKRVKTVGRPFSAKKVIIIDEYGKEVKNGVAGEIGVIDEGNLMLGYYNLPEEKQAIDKNHILHTGDMGYFDSDGYLILSGRIKDIITKSGENISPIEIERVIIEDENVKDVKVIGAPHHYFGESIEACVVLKDKIKFDEASIKNNIKTKLSSFKVPANFYIFDSFPLNANGKLDMRKLKADFLEIHTKHIISESMMVGLKIGSIKVSALNMSVRGVAAHVEALVQSIGFDDKRSQEIRLVLEEMMLYCIENAFSKESEINIVSVLGQDMLIFAVHYEGEYKDLKEVITEDGMIKIILDKTDSVTITEYNGKKYYYLEFLYPKELDVISLLYKETL